MGLNEKSAGIWRLSLEQIEATVADHLGRGRVPGNQPGPCFSRQVAMYLAKNVAGWSTTRIGRFYNGRHHTTVLHAIAKIERLRQKDETIDAVRSLKPHPLVEAGAHPLGMWMSILVVQAEQRRLRAEKAKAAEQVKQ